MESSFSREPTEAEINDPNRAWLYNVIDEFKPLAPEEIKLRVESRRLPYGLAIINTEKDFNIATAMRNANAFGANIYYVGTKKFDRRGLCGIQNYSPINHLKDIEELKKLKSQYTFVAMELTDTAVELASFEWPVNSLIIVGQESKGLTPEILSLCEHQVKCSMLGSVRSINMGCASSIALYSYMSQHKK